MSSSITIRKAHREDIETIVEFQQKMAWETEQLELDSATVHEGVKRLFIEPQRGNYWVAEVDGVIVASTLVLYEWSDWRNGDVMWVHSVFVLAEHRKRGIFKKMFTYLKEIVEDSSSYKGIRLYVEKTNTNAQKVYKAIGMSNEHYDLYEWLK